MGLCQSTKAASRINNNTNHAATIDNNGEKSAEEESEEAGIDFITWEKDSGIYPKYFSNYEMQQVKRRQSDKNDQQPIFSIGGGDGFFRHEGVLLHRVRAMASWAVHGLVFEFVEGGTRAGYIVEPNGSLKPSMTDQDILERGGSSDWIYIPPGDYIVEIHGFNLTRGKQYLCHSITLEFASGKSIRSSSRNEMWKGTPFRFVVADKYALPFMPLFREGGCLGIASLQTSIHLPLALPNSEFYPNRDILLQVLLVFSRIDSHILVKSLGRDVWWHILGMLHSRDIAPYDPLSRPFVWP